MEDWVKIICDVLGGIIVCLPLVLKLVQFIIAAVKEKNWAEIIKVVLNLMQEAEGKFIEGEAKKAWVMAGVEMAAKSINYTYDEAAKQKVSDMIDSICAASKKLNVGAKIVKA